MPNTTAEEQLSIPDSMVSGQIARMRLFTGLLQGLILYLLYQAGAAKVWPATQPYVFLPLLLSMVFVPIIFISSLGHLKNSVILRWLLAVAIIVSTLAVYDLWRVGFIEYANTNPHIYPSPMLGFYLTVGLFIAHALVFAAALDQHYIADYRTYFEAAWKLAIQLKFAGLFLGILWGILFLGAELFTLVKLDFLEKLLQKSWFAIPVSVFAVAFALHITDVRPGIVRGIRTLLLVLLSWLLPVVTLIVSGFIISLPFTGLEPLWATRNATAVLLGAAAVLIILMNTAYQNGEVGAQLSRVIRLLTRVAALLLAPLMIIAIYALALRVQQYGWTNDRIIAASCLLVGSCYSIGYVWAATEKNNWLQRMAPTNIVAALLVLAVLLALFTPIADPARLSVNNQLSRLYTGKIKPADFDTDYLKFDGERYGMDALQQLNESWQGEDAVLLRKKIAETQLRKSRWDKQDKMDIKANLRNITVWPKGQVLPESFLAQPWDKVTNGWLIPDCLRYNNQQCDAFMLDLNADNKPEILLISQSEYTYPMLLAQQADTTWKLIGTYTTDKRGCSQQLATELKTGSYKLIAPGMKDIEVLGKRFGFSADTNNYLDCED